MNNNNLQHAHDRQFRTTKENGTKMNELINELRNGCCDYEITFETLSSY